MSNNNEHLKDYLNGLMRVRRDELEQLGQLMNWRELAQREIEHRITALIRGFDDALLHAIANGEIDVNATIKEVLAAN